MISVANPIYDTVFKYLVEDLRVAKTLLSALLKREVAEVDGQLAEKDRALLDSAKVLKLTGMSLEEISALTHLPVDVLKKNL